MFVLSGGTICLGIVVWFFIKPPGSRFSVALLCVAVLFLGITAGAGTIRQTIGDLIGKTNETVDKTVIKP